MPSEAKERVQTGHTPAALRWGLAAGFLAFGIDHGASFVVRRPACAVGSMQPLHVLTVVCLVLAISGLYLSWSTMRGLPAEKTEEGGQPHDRAHFQALMAILFNMSFIVAIIASAVPRWMLHVCE